MENQHRKIKGYLELSKEEINLMNKIKAHGEQTAKLLDEIYLETCHTPDGTDAHKLAKDFLKTGQMWLVRAVARPESF